MDLEWKTGYNIVSYFTQQEPYYEPQKPPENLAQKVFKQSGELRAFRENSTKREVRQSLTYFTATVNPYSMYTYT